MKTTERFKIVSSFNNSTVEHYRLVQAVFRATSEKVETSDKTKVEKQRFFEKSNPKR